MACEVCWCVVTLQAMTKIAKDIMENETIVTAYKKSATFSSVLKRRSLTGNGEIASHRLGVGLQSTSRLPPPPDFFVFGNLFSTSTTKLFFDSSTLVLCTVRMHSPLGRFSLMIERSHVLNRRNELNDRSIGV